MKKTRIFGLYGMVAVIVTMLMAAAVAGMNEAASYSNSTNANIIDSEAGIEEGQIDQPVNSSMNGKTIYLTFDDGPSCPVTNNILDILKEKHVNATFFVIGSKISTKQDVLKRIHDEGNAIGLHTFTHDYARIYRSHDAFIDEMDKTSDEVFNALGIRTTSIRFPAGSKGHLNALLHEKLKQRGYRVFDWNARITDGVHPKFAPETYLGEAVKSGRKWNTIFMLMHCDAQNFNTCRALPSIIEYYKQNGYEFKIIDESTPEYYFRFEKRM